LQICFFVFSLLFEKCRKSSCHCFIGGYLTGYTSCSTIRILHNNYAISISNRGLIILFFWMCPLIQLLERLKKPKKTTTHFHTNWHWLHLILSCSVKSNWSNHQERCERGTLVALSLLLPSLPWIFLSTWEVIRKFPSRMWDMSVCTNPSELLLVRHSPTVETWCQ
jgi:hypothetical protein